MAETILRRPGVTQATGLSRSVIYAKMDSSSPYFDPDFPKPLRLGRRAVGWRASDIAAWLETRERSAR